MTELREQSAALHDLRRIAADLDLPVDHVAGDPDQIRAALEERRQDKRIQLVDLADWMRHHGPTASALALKVSLELELAECDRALGVAALPAATEAPGKPPGAPDGTTNLNENNGGS